MTKSGIADLAQSIENLCGILEKWLNAVLEIIKPFMARYRRLFLHQAFPRLQWLWARLPDDIILAMPIGEETMQLWMNEEMPTVI